MNKNKGEIITNRYIDSLIESGFQRLTTDDREKFDFYYEKMNDNWVSTLSFASMIAWNKSIEIYYRTFGNYISCLAHDTVCGEWYAIPLIGHYDIDELEQGVDELVQVMDKIGLPIIFVSVSEWMLPYYIGLKCISLKVDYDPCLSDYIYKRSDFLEALNSQGSRYDYNYFIKKNNPDLERIDHQNTEQYISFVKESYCSFHDCKGCVYGCQLDTVRNITQNIDKTGAKGIVAYVNDKIAGYTIVTNEKSQLIYHFKENLRKFRGISVFLNRKCLELYGENSEIINYTEDMGLEGLRRYKQKLAVYHFCHKYELHRME